MTNILIKLFIKNYKNLTSFSVRQKYGKFSGIIGIITNFLLFVIKLIAGFVSGSISVIADAVNNLSDSVSSVVTLTGFQLSSKPADEEHPYGHARMEYISGLIISVVVLLIGFQLALSSINKIVSDTMPEFDLVVMSILIISIFIKVWQYLFYRKISRLIDSRTVKAASIDSRNDIFVTSAVLLTVLLNRYADVDIDGYSGIAVSGFIIFSGIKLLKETISPLLGLAPSRELIRNISEKILSYDKVIGLHDLNIHNYGYSRCYASVHCEMPSEQDIMISHDIADNIERDFLYDMNIHLVIHIDPVVTDDPKINTLRSDVENIISKISSDIKMHDFRVSYGVSHSNLIFDVQIPYDFILSEKEIISQISDKISSRDPSYRCNITIDRRA